MSIEFNALIFRFLAGEVRETDDQNVELIRDTWQDYSEKLFTDKAVQIIRV